MSNIPHGINGHQPKLCDNPYCNPQASHTSKELEEELDTFLNNSDWGVTLFAGHRDVLVKNVAKFIKERESILLKKLSFHLGVSYEELVKLSKSKVSE